MVHKKKLFRKSSVKYRTFSEGPTWSVLYPLCSYKKWNAVINCPKIVACTVNIVKFLVCIIFKHPWKAISLMFEIEICGPCLLWKMKWGRGQHGPSGTPVATPLRIWKIFTLWRMEFALTLEFVIRIYRYLRFSVI